MLRAPSRLPPTHLTLEAFVVAAQRPRSNACFREGLVDQLHRVHDDQKWSALDLAITMDLPLALKRLISSGSPLDMHEGSGITALGYAVSQGNAPMARMLIEAGASIEALRAHFSSPLILAAHRDEAECAALLIEAGANLFWRCKKGHDALAYARGIGADDLAALIERAIVEKESRDLTACLAPGLAFSYKKTRL